MKKKGLVLLSGGLDSTLATKVMLDQGVELEAVNFVTCFCTCTKKGCKNEAAKVSENFGIKINILNVTREYIDVIRNPKHGYGSNINPCLDCRIFMFRKAKEVMETIGASFIVTGEVLGSRPMSQRGDAIRLIEKESGLKGLIVRPLSAKLLEPSLAEEAGVIDRDKLLNISGRSRKQQISMAKDYNINDYPCPAGGCLLTDKGFAVRMRDLMAHDEYNLENIRLLRVGRHFRIGERSKLIVGRNESENGSILHMASEGDVLFDAKEISGPTGLFRGDISTKNAFEVSASIITRYSDNDDKEITVTYWKYPDNTLGDIVSVPAKEELLTKLRI